MTMVDPHHLRRVQLIRKGALALAIIAVVALAAISHSLGGDTRVHEGLEAVGIGLVFAFLLAPWAAETTGDPAS